VGRNQVTKALQLLYAFNLAGDVDLELVKLAFERMKLDPSSAAHRASFGHLIQPLEV
jgi:hypothetical protein